MCDFDVILGMDLIDAHCAMIDYLKKRVRFSPPNAKSFKFQETHSSGLAPAISTFQARNLLDRRCQWYLANIVDQTKKRESMPEDIPVVKSTCQSSRTTFQGCYPIERSSSV